MPDKHEVGGSSPLGPTSETVFRQNKIIVKREGRADGNSSGNGSLLYSQSGETAGGNFCGVFSGEASVH